VNAFTYPLASLRNHRLRSLLTAAGVGAALASMLALVGLSRGVDQATLLSLKDRGTDIVAIDKGSVEILTAELDEGQVDRIRAVPGVASAMGSVGEFVSLEEGEMAYVAGWPLGTYIWSDLKVTAGRLPLPGERDRVVMGEALAEALGKKTGDTIELSGQDFVICGIVKEQSVIDDRSIMVPLPVLQDLIAEPGKVSGFQVRVDRPDDPARVDDVRDRLAAAFPNLSFIESADMAHSSQITNLLRAMAWASSTIAMGMAAVIVLNTLLMAVTERMRDMGLLSAIGWTPARVIASVIVEGVLLTIAGSVAGVALGLLGLQLLIRNPELGTFLQPDVTLGLVLQSVGMVLAIGVLGGLYPAWRATHIRPTELLRAE
jgi:putative ABC transport system permease protein